MDFPQSVSAEVSIEGVGVSASDTFEENTSQSVSTLNTSAQTLSASFGMQVTKPAFAGPISSAYLYDFAGYVLGVTNPNTVLQSIALQDGQGNPSSSSCSASPASGPTTPT